MYNRSQKLGSGLSAYKRARLNEKLLDTYIALVFNKINSNAAVNVDRRYIVQRQAVHIIAQMGPIQGDLKNGVVSVGKLNLKIVLKDQNSNRKWLSNVQRVLVALLRPPFIVNQ